MCLMGEEEWESPLMIRWDFNGQDIVPFPPLPWMKDWEDNLCFALSPW